MKKAIAVFIASAVTVLLGNAVTKMLFGAIGVTQTSKGWNLVVALYVFLILSAIFAFVSALVPSSLQKTCYGASVFCSGALGGFFYGGTISQNNSQIALLTAIVVGLVSGLLVWFLPSWLGLAGKVAAGICAYGFALAAGVYSISLVAVTSWLPGIIWGGICLLFLTLTIAIANNQFRSFKS